jgi:hypothetical protein
LKVLARLTLFSALFLPGCHSSGGGSNASTLQPSAAMSAAQGGVWARLPAPVAAAFRASHPKIAPIRLHVRLFPDGTTRYQVMYVDADGQTRYASYYADGRNVP